MSEPVQSIVDAVRSLTAEQRQELAEALATMEASSRRELIDSIKGKYRHVPTSSESFLERKREDVATESRR